MSDGATGKLHELPPPPPNKQCVEALEELLVRAKRGEFCAFVGATEDNSGGITRYIVGEFTRAHMVHSLEALKFSIFEEASRQRREADGQ